MFHSFVREKDTVEEEIFFCARCRLLLGHDGRSIQTTPAAMQQAVLDAATGGISPTSKAKYIKVQLQRLRRPHGWRRPWH